MTATTLSVTKRVGRHLLLKGRAAEGARSSTLRAAKTRALAEKVIFIVRAAEAQFNFYKRQHVKGRRRRRRRRQWR